MNSLLVFNSKSSTFAEDVQRLKTSGSSSAKLDNQT